MSNRKKKKYPDIISTTHFDRKTGEGYTYQKNAQSMREYKQQVKTYRGDVRAGVKRDAARIADYNNYVAQAVGRFNDAALRQSIENKIDDVHGRAAGVFKDQQNEKNKPGLASIRNVNGINEAILPEPVKAEDTPITWLLNSLGSMYMHAYHVQTHPLTSLFLATNSAYQKNHGGVLDWTMTGDQAKNVWGQAWHDTSATDFRSMKPKNLEGGDAISLGQAALSNFGATLPGGNAQDKATINKITGVGDPTSPEYRKNLEKMREAAPEVLGQPIDLPDVFSGIYDAGPQVYGADAMSLVAAGFKALRASSRITIAAKDSVKATENIRYVGKMLDVSKDGAVKNPVGDWADALTKSESISHVQALFRAKKIYGHDDVAALFVNAKTREHTDLLIRAGIQDPEAMATLKAGYQNDYAVFMARDQEMADQLAAWDVHLPGMAAPANTVVSKNRVLHIDTENIVADHYTQAKQATVPAKYIYNESTFSKTSTLGKGAEHGASGAPITRPTIKTTLLDQAAADGRWHSFDTKPMPDWVKNVRDDKDFREGYMRARANADPSLAEGLMMGLNPEMTVNSSMMMADFGSKIPVFRGLESKLSNAVALGKARNTFRFTGDHNWSSWTGGGASNSDPGKLSFHTGGRLEPLIGLLRWNFREHATGTYVLKGVGRDNTLPEATAAMNAVPSLRTAAGGVFKEQQKLKLAESLHSPGAAERAVAQHELDMVEEIAKQHVDNFLAKQGIREGDEGYKAARQEFIDDKVKATVSLQAQRDEASKRFIDAGGFMWDANSGTWFTSPQLAEQLRTSKAVLDFKQLDNEMAKAVHGDGTWLTKSLHKTGDTAYALNEGFQSVWRPVTLLRAAYPMRNTIEGFSRVLALVGAHSVMNSMGETALNIGVNATRKVGRKGRIGQAREDVSASVRVAMDRRTALESAEQALKEMSPDDILAHTDLQNNVNKLRGELDKAQSAAEASQAKLDKVSSFKRIAEDGAFGGKSGLAAYARAGNDNTWSAVTTGATDARVTNLRKKMLVTNTPVTMADGIDTYAASANKLINHILTGNRVTKMRLDPNVTPDAFYKWFISSRDARLELAAHQSLGMDITNEAGVKAWFQAGRENLHAMIPDQHMQELISTGKQIPEGEIRAFVERAKDVLPPINGEKIMAYHGPRRGAMRWWKDFAGKMFQAIGSLPEKTLVRAPYYEARWTEYLDQVKLSLSPDAGKDAWAKAYMEAHRYATHKMNTDLYTIVRQKNLTAAVEKISPFWTAQINTLATWPRILWENPKAIGSIAETYVRARQGGFVDDEGWFHPLPGVKFGSGDGALDIKIPFGNIMSVFAGNLNTETADLISQATGEPTGDRGGMLGGFLSSIFPSPGPVISVAGSLAQNHELLRKMGVPDWIADSTYRWLNNYGPSDDGRVWDKLVPGYVRTIHDALDTSSQAATTTQVQIFQVEYEKYQMGLRKDPPTPEEVVAKARTTMLFLAAGQWALPGSPRKISPLQPMLTQWWDMQKAYGSNEAHARWQDMYGDDFLAVTSLTGTDKITGLQPSKASWRVFKDNPELIKNIIGVTGDPSSVAMLTGAMGYNQNVDSKEYMNYRRMMMNANVPGTDSKAIVGRTPEEMAAQMRLVEGWRQYRELVTLPADAQKRMLAKQFGGWKKVPKQLTKEMYKYRKEQVKKIGEANPEWKTEWDQGPKKGKRAVETLKKITTDQKFMKENGKDPYWQSVIQFLDARTAVESAMVGGVPKYGAQTPKEEIRAKAKYAKSQGWHFSKESTRKFNQKIRDKADKPGTVGYKQWQLAKYENTVDRLKRKNVHFADMYDSWFSNESFNPNRFS